MGKQPPKKAPREITILNVCYVYQIFYIDIEKISQKK